ncbi:MAG: tetratricopeptide repeat protein [Duganella sp.]
MKYTLHTLLGVSALLAALAPSAARAQQAPAEEDLYLSAMQSIAEGRRGDASDILNKLLSKGAQHAGEWLDLAMIQCALGHADDAEALFQRIEREFAPPQGIRDIIAQQRLLGCQRWSAQSLWGASATRGRDSNVNQGSISPFYTNGDGISLELLPEYRPKGDHYSAVSADYLRELNAAGDLVFVQAYLRKYDHLSAYDTASAFVGGEHQWQLGKWQMRTSGLVGALTLGGALYQQQAQAQLRVAPPQKLPKGYDFSVLGSVSRLRYQTLSNFDATTYEIRPVLGYRSERGQAQLSAGYQRDLGNVRRPGGDRTGWSARFYGRRVLIADIQAELELSSQHWNGAAAYSPGLIDTVRRQNNTVLRSVLTYPLGNGHSVQLEWRQARNRESVSIFQYNSRQVQLSWRWSGL